MSQAECKDLAGFKERYGFLHDEVYKSLENMYKQSQYNDVNEFANYANERDLVDSAYIDAFYHLAFKVKVLREYLEELIGLCEKSKGLFRDVLEAKKLFLWIERHKELIESW